MEKTRAIFNFEFTANELIRDFHVENSTNIFANTPNYYSWIFLQIGILNDVKKSILFITLFFNTLLNFKQ